MQAFLNRSRLAGVFPLLVAASMAAASFPGKNATKTVDPNDVTLQLFRLLDDSYSGKFDDYLLADQYTDAATGQQYRHILRIEYDKNRSFGRLSLYVRAVGEMTQEQQAVYRAKEIFDFAETDLEKFIKTDAGSFGGSGDLYFHSVNGGPLAHAAINDDVQKRYTDIVTQYVIPALEKDHKTP